jgi:hypothetical protein
MRLIVGLVMTVEFSPPVIMNDDHHIIAGICFDLIFFADPYQIAFPNYRHDILCFDE